MHPRSAPVPPPGVQQHQRPSAAGQPGAPESTRHPADQAPGHVGGQVTDNVTDNMEGRASGHLDYLSRVSRELGVTDPVEQYYAPTVGRWSEMHVAAGRWRAAAKAAEDVANRLTEPLGGLDASWKGKDADSFMAHMQGVGLAGHDMSDAMGAMADALDGIGNGVRQIISDMVDVLADSAETVSEALVVPVRGEQRARQLLDELHRPTSEMHEAVRDALQAFAKLCDGVHGDDVFSQVTMRHHFPEKDWTPAPAPVPPRAGATVSAPRPAVPSVSPPAVADTGGPAPTGGGGHGSHGGGHGGGGASGGTGGLAPLAGAGPGQAPAPGGFTTAVENDPSSPAPNVGGSASGQDGGRSGQGVGAMGGVPMGGMGAGGQGGDQERKGRSRITSDPLELFGEPVKTAPPTIGEDD